MLPTEKRFVSKLPTENRHKRGVYLKYGLFILQTTLLLLLLLPYELNSTPEPTVSLDHEGNRKGDISSS